jgi:hypothetical protein
MTRSVIQLGGQALKLDADGDTTIQVSSDDVLIVDTAGNEALKIDANGHITKPLQSAFLIRSTSNQDNISTNTNVYPAFNSEVFDNNADATVSTGDGQGGDGSNVKAIFTAPVTGRYQLNVMLYLYQVPSDTSYLYVLIKTSNREYINIFDTGAFDSTADYMTVNNAVLADMDASDTAEIIVQQVNGSQTLDIIGNSTHGHTSFSGYLVA